PAKQYIDAELTVRLTSHIRNRVKSAKLFPFTDQRNVATMLRSDLANARKEWIDAATTQTEIKRRQCDDFLAVENADAETLDFHALRHTCGAWLAIAGVHPKIIQTVMRHGTITLTMDRYGHLFPGQDAAAVNSIAAVMRGEIDPLAITKAA
ncbi:MAG: tyrosine-type recombinase/integrase, partial [Rubripirellula sp.]